MNKATVVGYIGDVKLKYLKNGKMLEWSGHNTGYPALFETLSNLLAGRGFPYGSPSYVKIMATRTTESDPMEIEVTGEVPLSRAPSVIQTTDSGIWGCCFNTTISYYDVGSYEYRPATDTVRLVLYASDSSDVKTPLADVRIDGDAVPTTGVQLYIEWNLLFANAVPVENEDSQIPIGD